jgi:hypothetical protein
LFRWKPRVPRLAAGNRMPDLGRLSGGGPVPGRSRPLGEPGEAWVDVHQRAALGAAPALITAGSAAAAAPGLAVPAGASTGTAQISPEQAGYTATGAQFALVRASGYLRQPGQYAGEVSPYSRYPTTEKTQRDAPITRTVQAFQPGDITFPH